MSRLSHISFIVGVALIISSCAQTRPVSVESRYTSAMFVRALDNSSTAPDFVLITVVDARSGETRIVCTLASGLEGALHMEFGIPYDETGVRRVHDLALQQPDRIFRFSNPEALAHVSPDYSSKDLDVIRAETASRSDSELLNYELIQSLYMRKYLYLTNHRIEMRGRYKHAVAHVLLERGISCRRGCIMADLNPYK